MKKICLFFAMFWMTLAYSQSNLKLNVSSGINYSFVKFNDRGGILEEHDLKSDLPLGFVLDIGVEADISKRFAIMTGIRYSDHHTSPQMDLGFYYGGRFSFDNDTINVNAGYLKNFNYQLLSIPFAMKRLIIKKENFGLFIVGGGEVGFQIKQEEVFSGHYPWQVEQGIPNQTLTAVNQKIQLFNTAIILGGGMNFKVYKNLNLFVQVRAHVIEFRKKADVSTAIWPNSIDNLPFWDDEILPIGQLSMSFGIQKVLGNR